jgi:hypothetical protein
MFIGGKITFPALRDYILSHKINQGDIIILNPLDYEELIHEMKASGDGTIDIPVKLLGVLINRDSTDAVPVGKVQIVNAEKPF